LKHQNNCNKNWKPPEVKLRAIVCSRKETGCTEVRSYSMLEIRREVVIEKDRVQMQSKIKSRTPRDEGHTIA
jgi:hypothetical protein